MRSCIVDIRWWSSGPTVILLPSEYTLILPRYPTEASEAYGQSQEASYPNHLGCAADTPSRIETITDMSQSQVAVGMKAVCSICLEALLGDDSEGKAYKQGAWRGCGMCIAREWEIKTSTEYQWFPNFRPRLSYRLHRYRYRESRPFRPWFRYWMPEMPAVSQR